MKRYWIIIVVLLVVLCLWLLMEYSPEHGDAKDDYAYHLQITEIVPLPIDGEKPAIELHNPHDREVSATGLKLVINNAFEYVLPEELPPVSPGAFIVIKFDGKGANLNDYLFRDGVTVLHASQGLDRAFVREDARSTGEVSVYQIDEQAVEKLVTFVAWGGPAKVSGRSSQRALLWPIGAFVRSSESFGLYPADSEGLNAYSIGLLPLSRMARLQDWTVYNREEITLGAANAVSAPKKFTAPDGTVFRTGDLVIGWTGSQHAREYEFELARDEGFTDIVDRKVIKKPLYRPTTPLAAGEYFYRVRTINKDGVQSGWSNARRVGTKDMAGGVLGAVEKRVIQAADYRRQRKDTQLLCIDSCASEHGLPADQPWDDIHPDDVPIYGHDHGDMNCVRASMSMIASHFGKQLSQDRIAYYDREERPGRGDGTPLFDLAHSVGYAPADVQPVFEWVLDEATDRSAVTDPSFADIRGWLDDDRPIMTATCSHMRVLSGYRIDDAGDEWVQIMDPWTGPPAGSWETYDSWATGNCHAVWIAPANAPNTRSDEDSVWNDTDGDGVMDFDEQFRFATKRFKKDADNDDVEDKNDIREYVFNVADNYDLRTADLDVDTIRKENDPDNDHDTFSDGCEDANGNGKRDPGEIGDNFDNTTAGLLCAEKPVHCVIVFDRSGSMSIPTADPKYNRALDAASLFLDAWLLNAPIPGTEIGVVFYDHTAFFDTTVANETTLEPLTAAKRDKILSAFADNRPSGGSTSIGGGILEAMEVNGFDIANVPHEDQRRVIVILTDGKENASPRMDSFQVLQSLVDGQVSGYVLGIGDEPQIDADKLNALADILGNFPASFATDLLPAELEKFFLQVLAETRGLDFAVDPSGTLTYGQPEEVIVPVSQGAQRATFVLVWDNPNAILDFGLTDPNNNPVTALASRAGRRYRVATTDSPAPGDWKITLTSNTNDGSGVAGPVEYSIMVLENNAEVNARFEVRGGFFLKEPMLVQADLSRSRQKFANASLKVEVTRPTMALDRFLSGVPIRAPAKSQRIERSVKTTWQDKTAAAMAKQNIKRPTATETIWLKDDGQNGDAIPGDGRYTGYFTNTQIGGIYSFRFIAESTSKEKRGRLHREKFVTVFVKPRIQPNPE